MKGRQKKSTLIFISLITLFTFLITNSVSAASNIDPVYKYAWSDTAGWINFNCDGCNLNVTNYNLSGYAWSQNYGWINLNPQNSGISNNGNGDLSGFAWGENLGWIDFSNVKIDPGTGIFSGFATILGPVGGKINFDCQNCKVKTSWRKQTLGGGGGLIDKTSKEFARFLELFVKFLMALIKPPELKEKPKETIEKPSPKEIVEREIIKEYPQPKPKEKPQKTKEEITTTTQPYPPIEREQPLPEKTPEEILILFNNIPKLKQSFPFTTFDSLKRSLIISEITIPSLEEILGFKLGKEFFLDKLSNEEKEKIPTDIIFPLTKNGISLRTVLSLNKNKVVRKLIGIEELNIVLVFKPSREILNLYSEILTSKNTSFLEKILTKITDLVKAQEVNQQKIKYTDEDKDGIYIAELKLSKTDEGTNEVEIKTIVEYKSNEEGATSEKKESRMIVNIEPKGYVHEIKNGQEKSVQKAEVYLYFQNPETNKFEKWPGEKFNQENPQLTDQEGKYIFIVQPGTYYFEVKKSGYEPYKSEKFEINKKQFINEKVNLKPLSKFILDKTTLIILLGVGILIIGIFFVFRFLKR